MFYVYCIFALYLKVCWLKLNCFDKNINVDHWHSSKTTYGKVKVVVISGTHVKVLLLSEVLTFPIVLTLWDYQNVIFSKLYKHTSK